MYSFETSQHFSYKHLAAEIARSSEMSALCTLIESSDRAVSVRLPIIGSGIALRVVYRDSCFKIGAYGLYPEATQWLNEMVVIQSTIQLIDNNQILHVLHETSDASEILKCVVRAAQHLMKLRKQEEADEFSDELTTSMYWASETFNFGDWIGPKVVHGFTGRQPVHIRRTRKNRRALFTVGSIVGVVRRNNSDIWGSGLIKPLTKEEISSKKKLTGIKVHAVRGKLTQEHLQNDLAWDVPDVFGDPALLLPELLPYNSGKNTDFVCVPHYVHRDKILAAQQNIPVIDVRHEVSKIVNQIASSNAVVSSSLHGIIIAQAYGIPWVRLNVSDRPLTGTDFKFQDFYSCLNGDTPAEFTVSESKFSSLDFSTIAKEATLPRLNIDLDALRDSLPVKVAAKSTLSLFNA